MINWSKAMEIDREPERLTGWIKEAVHIRKAGQHAMNLDEDSYQLSHAYDRFLDTASSCRVKNRKNWVPAFSDEGLWYTVPLIEVETSILGNNFFDKFISIILFLLFLCTCWFAWHYDGEMNITINHGCFDDAVVKIFPLIVHTSWQPRAFMRAC